MYLNATDQLCGIERYKGSEYRGSLVCPVVFLWKRPGQPSDPKAIAGALRHGADVGVVEKRTVKGFDWYRILDTEELGFDGWVRAPFLLELGKTEAEERT
jgi:hypothetical protein